MMRQLKLNFRERQFLNKKKQFWDFLNKILFKTIQEAEEE
jgi:hypothetical protein